MILDCVAVGSVSSVSAMVLMEDSERAAAIARERGIDAGLHLNFTAPFSAPCSDKLVAAQGRLLRFLLSNRLAPMLFRPDLATSFEYVVKVQLDEYRRLYGSEPGRIDGHHHMHLAANVLLAHLMPRGVHARRNFSFRTGEKSWANRLYRRTVDKFLARRYRLSDYLFALAPVNVTGRLQRIFSLSRCYVVEVETHPVAPAEYRLLTSGELRRLAGSASIAAPSAGFRALNQMQQTHVLPNRIQS
jgi:predicted glycoside hydrolase/deacetylase ChbG (UPF0249 family)